MKNTPKYSLAPFALAALVAFPGAALAQGPYVGVSGSVVLPEDSSNEGEFDATVPATPDFGEIPTGTELAWNTEFDTGWAISGQAGYAFTNGFRLEVEASYSEYDVDTHTGLTVGGTNIDGVDVAILTRGAADPANPTVGAVIADGQGKVSNFGLFGNVYYDIQTGTPFKPYVGGGIGYQWVDVDYSPSGVAIGNDDDGVFAYQLMAGASFDVTPNVQLFGQYTWRDATEEAEIPLTLVPATLEVESSQSLISAGVRVGF